MTSTESPPEIEPGRAQDQNSVESGGAPGGRSTQGQGPAPAVQKIAVNDESAHAATGAEDDASGSADIAMMDTSGLVEKHVTRPATLTPAERKVQPHNTARANRMNQRDATAGAAEDDAALA